jgi:alpha/beta superfamily hydrolase
MKVLLLGGVSISNQEWLRAMGRALKSIDSKLEVISHNYHFWEHGVVSENDLEQTDHEIAHALKLYGDSKVDLIIGKSFGAHVALKLSGVVEPHKQLLIGTPIKESKKIKIDLLELLRDTKSQTILVTNLEDPVVGKVNIQSLMIANRLIKASYIKSQDSHKYEDHFTYANLLLE